MAAAPASASKVHIVSSVVVETPMAIIFFGRSPKNVISMQRKSPLYSLYVPPAHVQHVKVALRWGRGRRAALLYLGVCFSRLPICRLPGRS